MSYSAQVMSLMMKEANDKITELEEKLMIADSQRKMLWHRYHEKRAELTNSKSALKNFMKKTVVYLEVFPDDKELRRYREDAQKLLSEEEVL